MGTFLPFSRPTIDEATIAAVAEVLRSGWITSGPKVQEFEKQLSAYFGGRPVRTFNSGTCTMEIALRIAGIGPGDEVITSPISWVATANVILEVGAVPVFADIDPVTRNIDLDKVEAAITPRTKAIIPVYLAGKPVDMDRLYAIANKYKLRVIEDAAQAIGSSWRGKPIGSFGGSSGDFVSFSFQANKNITTSEGGCLVLNNEDEAKLAEKYRLQGVTRSGWDGIEVDVLGGKYNMTDVAAAIGLGQFAQLDAITAQRRKLAKHYFATLGRDFEKQTGAQLPPEDYESTNWHLFQVVLPERITRADFMSQMKEHNIGVGYHYAPIHLFKLYRALGFREGMFPIAERVGKQIVSLPMFYAMNEADVERACEAMWEVLASQRRAQ
jgi:dTDP-4-amino-4,6-dideoxygalactose transaminase